MHKSKGITKALKAAFPLTVPVLMGFLFLGIAFGVLMSTTGYAVIWSFMMSAVAYCGSMQFVAISLLTQAFNPYQAFFLALIVNARHLFYGLSMLPKYKGVGKVKPLLIFWMADETFSISCSNDPPEGVNKTWFYFFISALDYLYWQTGTLIGAIFGSLVAFNTKGLDFALTALFVVIFIDQLKEKKNRIPGLIGVACTVVCLLIFGSSNFILPAMGAILLALTLGRKPLERRVA